MGILAELRVCFSSNVNVHRIDVMLRQCFGKQFKLEALEDDIYLLDPLTHLYTQDYARGDILRIAAMCNFLRHHDRYCHIVYQGDTGTSGEVFREEEQDRLLRFFYSHGHIPYESRPNSPICEECHVPMSLRRISGGIDTFDCRSCHTVVHVAKKFNVN